METIEVSRWVSMLMVVVFGTLMVVWLYWFVRNPSHLNAWILLLLVMPFLASVALTATSIGGSLFLVEPRHGLTIFQRATLVASRLDLAELLATIALICRGGMIVGAIGLLGGAASIMRTTSAERQILDHAAAKHDLPETER
jgi:hypothetical protein